MRIVLLLVAVFAGGLLAGALIWPGDRGPPRARGEAPRSSPESWEGADRLTDRGGIRDPGAGAVARRESPADVTAGTTPLHELANEAAAALDRTASREAAATFLSGDGTITGTVLDPEGRPVPGVIVTASPEAQPFDLALARRRARERPHEDRDLGDAARDAIEGELWRRQVRRTARTDPNGRYELTGLVDGRLGLAAYHEEYDIKPVSGESRVEADAVVDFLARPVRAVPVEVRLPDGAAPDYAWITWRGPQGNGSETWTADPGEIRFPVGSCRVKAQTFVPDALQSAEVERVVGTAASTEPLVLQLESRRVLTARLVLPDGLAMPDRVEFRLRRMESGSDDPDPGSLGKEEAARQASSSAPGKATWYDLESGRYLVAAFLDGRRLIAYATAELADGATDVDLDAAELTGGDSLAVTLLGPDGGTARGKAYFWILAGSGDKTAYHRPDVLRRTDGTWLVLVDEELRAKLGTDARAVLRIHAGDYGTAQETFDPRRPGAVTVRFREPSRLKLQADGYAGSGVEGRLFAALTDDQGVVAQRQIGADGTCDLGGIQPGGYQVVLYVREGGNRWPIARRPIALTAGDREHTVRVPALHTLTVRIAGRVRVNAVVLRSSDAEIGSLRRTARVQRGVATFDALAAGSYVVECGPRHVDVRVPASGEVVVE